MRSTISSVQPKTVNEHFQEIMAEPKFISTYNSKITVDDLPQWFDEQLFKKSLLV